MKRMKLFAALGLVALLADCGSSPPVQFFTLEPIQGQRPPPRISGAPVRVADVHVPPALDRNEMVRESAPNRLQVSDRHHWGAPLGEMTQRVLTQNLVRRLPEGMVVLPQGPAPAEANEILVDILQFEGDASGTVAFEGSWSLLKGSPGTPVLSRHVRLSETADPKDYGDQARAMSRILGRLADEIAAALAAHSRRDPA